MAEKTGKKESKAAEKEDKAAEYKEMLQRLQAEFENYRKRTEKEVQRYKEYAAAEFAKKALPVLDSFELALKHSDSNAEKLKKGIELIYAQLYTMLYAEGLKPIDAAGKRFDPYVHEAMMHQESEKEGVVLEEMQRGYMFKEAVLRHSKVKVGKKTKEAECAGINKDAREQGN